MSTKITPTVGRVVLVFFATAASAAMSGYALPADSSTPVPGLVTRVHSDTCINVAAFDVDGVSLPLTSVRLLQDGDERPTSGCWAEWMPYQIGQAKKQASEVARADEPKLPRVDTNDAAIECEIQAKGLTAPRVTPADIEANIASEHYFTADEGEIGTRWYAADSEEAMINLDDNIPNSLRLLTFCVLVLRNGFTVTGESACASPENFDAQIGRDIARQNAVQKIWPLMGYALKQQLHDAANLRPERGAAFPGYSAMQPHQQRVVDERADLDSRLTKLNTFIDGAMFNTLDADEQNLLKQQAATMAMYSDILTDRITAFAPANDA